MFSSNRPAPSLGAATAITWSITVRLTGDGRWGLPCGWTIRPSRVDERRYRPPSIALHRPRYNVAWSRARHAQVALEWPEDHRRRPGDALQRSGATHAVSLSRAGQGRREAFALRP